MMSYLKATSGDPRKPSEVKKYDRLALATDQPPQDGMVLVSLLLGLVGLVLKAKWASWAAIICLLSAFANTGNEPEYKQYISAFTFALIGLVNSYAVSATAWFPGLGGS